MKRLTNHLEVFDFFEANGIFVEVWPTKEALIILLPYLPWWAWVRRSWQKGAVERFRKNAAAEWTLSIVEAASDDSYKRKQQRENVRRYRQEALRKEWVARYGPAGKEWEPTFEQFEQSTWLAGKVCTFKESGRYPRKDLPICHSNHWLFGKPLKSRCSDAQCKHKESCSAYQDNKVVDSSVFPPSPVEGCQWPNPKVISVTPAAEGLPGLREWDFGETAESGSMSGRIVAPACFTLKDFAGLSPTFVRRPPALFLEAAPGTGGRHEPAMFRTQIIDGETACVNAECEVTWSAHRGCKEGE